MELLFKNVGKGLALVEKSTITQPELFSMDPTRSAFSSLYGHEIINTQVCGSPPDTPKSIEENESVFPDREYFMSFSYEPKCISCIIQTMKARRLSFYIKARLDYKTLGRKKHT